MKIRNISKTVLIIITFFLLFCELPQNPRNVDNAGIRNMKSLDSIKSRIPINTSLQCTVIIKYPEFLDSVSVFLSFDNKVKIATKFFAENDRNDTLFLFELPFTYDGVGDICIHWYKVNNTQDSICKSIEVFKTVPVAQVSQSKVVEYIDNSIIIKFKASDPDSNLFSYAVFYYKNTPLLMEEKEFLASQRVSAEISIPLSKQFLKNLPDTQTFFFFRVKDEMQQESNTANCTLIIKDTLPPLINILESFIDGSKKVTILPETLKTVVSDNWKVDSVKYNNKILNIIEKDTFDIVITDLDSGENLCIIEAWDRKGNYSKKEFKLNYEGKKVYPPEIKRFSQTINEREVFSTVNLDDYVTITDPEATYGKDSIKWKINIESADSQMSVSYDSISRKLTVIGPTGEIYHDRSLILSLTACTPNAHCNSIHSILFMVNEINDPPVINVKGQSKLFGTSFDTIFLDQCAYDPEGSDNIKFFWTIKRGKYFYPESLFTSTNICNEKGLCFPIRLFTGKVVIQPDTTKTKTVPSNESIIDSLTFILKSVEIGKSDTLTSSIIAQYIWYRLTRIEPGIIIPNLKLP
ncbi:MAG: hypothetical protein N2053_07960 [Chitinispirillaceae bacterium]|nr:hypothetical protein [Chitinispirillaceae bacterium]